MEAAAVGARMAKLREARGMTGTQLGRALGLSKSQISKIESGARRIDVSELAEMADVLGVTLGELLGTPRSRSLALAARVMTQPTDGADLDARRRLRQLLEAESVLGGVCGLRPAMPSVAGIAALERVEAEGLSRTRGSARATGERLAEVVREELGLGRAPLADIAELAERHLGVDVALWPVGDAVSGLCAHGDGVATILVNSQFSAGHERFSAAHELAHHLLSDPREVVIEANLYETSSPAEVRANAFAAAFLMPADSARELIGVAGVDAEVLGELLRHFRVSYQALVHRLRTLAIISRADAESWLAESATAALRAAGDSNPHELTGPTLTRRIPTRLWRAALKGYQSGQVGIGVLAGLADTDAETLYAKLAADGIVPPTVVDDLADI
jgi:Zn-dependent peptidase ImmA (M78 family)/transcriptional regulator with XRE-family HTH domain